MKNKLLFLLLFELFIATSLDAQQIRATQDFGIWIGVLLKKELPKKFELTLEQQLRTCQNTTRIDAYFADLGVNYTINKNFRLNGNVRYLHDVKKWSATENSLRYNLDLEFRAKFKKKLQLAYRFRFQQKFHDVLQRQRTPILQETIAFRNKLRLKYTYKKTHEFYCSAELFITSEIFREAYPDKLRFCLGDRIKTKVGTFNCSLGYEVNLQPNDAFSFFFVRAIYILKL